MRLPLLPLPLLPLLLAYVAGLDAGTASVSKDDNGNLHLNTTEPQRVFLNGRSALDELSALSALADTVNAFVVQVSASTQVSLSIATAQITSLTAQSASLAAALTAQASTITGLSTALSAQVLSTASLAASLASQISTSSSLAAQVQSLSISTAPPRAHVVGGLSNSTATRIFNGKSWTAARDMTTPRNSFFIGALGGTMYAAGGRTNQNTFSASIEKFNGTSWTTLPATMSIARGNGAAVTLNNRLYFIGGNVGGVAAGSSHSYSSLVETFNGITVSGAQSMTVARSSFDAAVHNGMIYVVGGFNNNGVLATSEVFNGAAWAAIASLTRPRFQHCVMAWNGGIYVVGGLNITGSVTPISVVERYTPSTNQWALQPSMLFNRTQLGCAVLDDTMYVFGGNGVSSSTTFESFTGAAWVLEGTMPWNIESVGVAVL
jgi:hypothetical protein